jgi:hypothetical protein
VGEELVKVAFARGSVEARLIKGLLESEGIPCLLQSFRGGGRAVMVHAGRAEDARALLAEAEARAETEADSLPDFATDEGLGAGFDRAPREPGPFGSHARGYLLALAILGLAFGAFLLVRAL